MGPRRRSREIALQLMFQNEFSLKVNPDEMLKNFAENFEVEPEVWSYARELVGGLQNMLPEVDALIQAHSTHWKLARMALVDLNVMRVAVFEMRFMQPGVPPNVAINEAIEIAKKFGSTDSGAFVNGILDQVKEKI